MRLFFIALFFVCFSSTIEAQSILNSRDLTSFKVDAITETEVLQIQSDLKTKGLSIDQLQDQFMAKGMSLTEFNKLKFRINNSIYTGNQKSNPLMRLGSRSNLDSNDRFDDTSSNDQLVFKKLNPLIYGSELFNQSRNSIATNQNIATPLNYIIGPNDVIKTLVYGVQEFIGELKVTKEGMINIQNVGQLKVSGLTLEAAYERIKQFMGKRTYPSLNTNESKLSLTLGEIRTIQVSVIGAMKSGKYNVSAMSNILSVITEAGGPNEIGSFRAIELIRNNKVETVVDLYHFMQTGDQKQMFSLRDNDVIRIPPYKSRIELKGQVKRPGIFELVNDESFKKVLEYAGGFDDTAYTDLVKVIQKTSKEKSVKDLNTSDYDSYKPNGGDLFIISKIIDRFQNRVKLSGAVYRPDIYELKQGMRVLDLLKKGDGLKDDAFINGAQLFRLKPNLIKEMINIDLRKALSGDKTENILLNREDELFVSSILDLRDTFNVDIYGEVHNPGKYQYVDSMTVKDLITLAGGSTFAANKKVEVARLFKQEGQSVKSNKIAILLTTELDGNLNFTTGNEDIVLQPYDVVSITKKVGYTDNQIITISGQVQFAGKYSLTSRVERVSDIIKRAGGLIGDAYGKGAYIKRESIRIDSVLKPTTSKDTLLTAALFKKDKTDNVQNIALDIDEILKNPGSYYDLVLSDKDEIIIPKVDNKISIRGGVLRPVTITYHEGITINECISAAGGLNQYSKRNKAYVVYYNGRAKRTRQFGFIRISPRLEPGSEVILPESNEVKKDIATTLVQLLSFAIQLGTSVATLKLLAK